VRKLFTFADLSAQDEAAFAAVAKGTTIFAASGDTGGLECVPSKWGSAPSQNDVGVWTPAVLPAVTGVGATALSVSSTGLTWASRLGFTRPWARALPAGTSTIFAQPAWQVARPAQAEQQGARQVPDVSAVGDPITGTAIYEGQWEQGGARLLQRPSGPGFTALIDQYLKHNGKPPVGYLNLTSTTSPTTRRYTRRYIW